MIVRDASPQDAEAMAGVLNQIIAAGGTTAHQHPMAAPEVQRFFIDGPDVETSVVAVVGAEVVGWQSLGLWREEMHIGTFVRIDTQAKGVGAALFARTLLMARAKGLREMIAHIRADNAAGLAYYHRLGFVDIGGDANFALDDGRVVGKIFRRFDLRGDNT